MNKDKMEIILGCAIGALFPPIMLVAAAKVAIDEKKHQKETTDKIHWTLNETKKYPMGFYYEGRA